jgi:hypothetical protein
MVHITNQINTYYKYNGKFYKISERKHFELGDIFFDGRDYEFKLIGTTHDLFDMSFVAPELYYILEEVTIQN